MWARDTPLHYLDEYWRVPNECGFSPSEIRRLLLSRSIVLEGAQADLDEEELKWAVSGLMYSLASPGEAVIDWGYTPTTDEVEILFSKG